jgi:hypothetical protein
VWLAGVEETLSPSVEAQTLMRALQSRQGRLTLATITDHKA